ncbi:MAG: hypothetical protein ABIQ43_00230 [Sphingomonas sp.]
MTTGVRTIAYHRPPGPWSGDRFEATMTNRQVELGFGSKRLHFTMRSSRFHRSARRAADGHGGSMLWRAMGYIGCASLALGLVVVSGSVLRASPPVAEYAVVMPIAAKLPSVAPRHKAKPRQVVSAKPVTRFAPLQNPVADWSLAPASDANDANLGIARPDPDVATLPTVNGERAVAVYGPSRSVGGKSCRDVSVFVRGTDGKVSVSPATQCEAAR